MFKDELKVIRDTAETIESLQVITVRQTLHEVDLEMQRLLWAGDAESPEDAYNKALINIGRSLG